MGELIVDRLSRTVQIRGHTFPVDCIRAVMLETGGQVVADSAINEHLDKAIAEHFAKSDKEPEALIIESEPTILFIPKRILVHDPLNKKGRKTNLYLYFAVKRMFHA